MLKTSRALRTAQPNVSSRCTASSGKTTFLSCLVIRRVTNDEGADIGAFGFQATFQTGRQ